MDEPTKEYPKFAADNAGRHARHDLRRGMGRVGWCIGLVILVWLVFVAYELGRMYRLWGN